LLFAGNHNKIFTGGFFISCLVSVTVDFKFKHPIFFFFVAVVKIRGIKQAFELLQYLFPETNNILNYSMKYWHDG